MRVEHNYDLYLHNGYRIHSIAKTAIFPETPQELEELFLGKSPNELLVMGRGFNIILSKEYYETPFVILDDNYSGIEFCESGCLVALSGTDMREVATVAADNSLAGLEIFCDIPSSVGGAVFMNASASGCGLDKTLKEVTVLMPKEGISKVFCFAEICGGYRYSIFQDNGGIISAAKFCLSREKRTIIKKRMDAIRESRHSKQPIDLPNAGSVFKRPDGHYVGQIIEELGLKGLRVGGAMVSPKHAGFIVNCGGATGGDVLMIIEKIQKQVIDSYGFRLELEQRII